MYLEIVSRVKNRVMNLSLKQNFELHVVLNAI